MATFKIQYSASATPIEATTLSDGSDVVTSVHSSIDKSVGGGKEISCSTTATNVAYKDYTTTDSYVEIDAATIETAFTNWCIDNGYSDGDELLEAVGEDEKYLEKGKYKLKQDVFTAKSEIRGRKGDIVIAFADTPSTDQVLGQHIFKVIHKRSSQEMYVALEDLSSA